MFSQHNQYELGRIFVKYERKSITHVCVLSDPLERHIVLVFKQLPRDQQMLMQEKHVQSL